ncbi:hypothetical protein EV580_1297 [Mycobacterium sp. BK086]|uniref:hypothetical protein n=1 Tax=Mycobacterium sp. BK086 TaxID=2512165 RepID=UPI00105C9869|nr:hypothetical protein [Mycobacterium sp. BK086]TDO18115.1 hypothetical protein EV580_1297 [Mycobacterium sp. BK086]
MPTLGRLLDHDARSRQFEARRATKPRSVLWGHHAPVLDQGDLGACTGNATAQLINTDFFEPSRSTQRPALPSGFLTEADAVHIYSLATRLDGIASNTYPPTDEGSSGLGAAKAGKKLGYFTGYRHCFGFDHFAAAVQLQPVIVGTNWYEAMFTPDIQGFVWPRGAVQGGHEYLCLGISYETKTLTFLNSWGDGWGRDGRFFMTFATFTKLLAEQGDATAPIGVSA